MVHDKGNASLLSEAPAAEMNTQASICRPLHDPTLNTSPPRHGETMLRMDGGGLSIVQCDRGETIAN
jgi:hypothetical protein